MKNKLDILLITYNRKKQLMRTLAEIFAENSPIKNFDITILDNASTDGSSELIDLYKNKFNNLKHVRHNINIGGNANICKALELAANHNKEYFWILCDDDTLRFKNWPEIESAINSNKYDCILTEYKQKFDANDYPNIINTLCFLPAGIYKTRHITSTVLHNAYANILYSFPHLALGCHLLNIKGNFYVPEKRIIKQGTNQTIIKKELEENKVKLKKQEKDCVRGTDSEVHFRIKHVNLFSGYVNSYNMITDKHLRNQCNKVLWIGKPFIVSAFAFLNENEFFPYNYSDFFWSINTAQKIQFLFATIIHILGCLISLYTTDKWIYIKFLGIKTKLCKYKFK